MDRLPSLSLDDSPTTNELERMKAKSPGKPLSTYIPEDLPACFSMIVVTPENGGPSAQPWFWAKKGSYWNFRQSCPDDPGQLPAVACAN